MQNQSIMRRWWLFLSAGLIATTVHAQVECPGDWTGKPVVISADRVNDGYCDCPLTGGDEPNTSACSGSDSWAGVASQQADETDNVPMTFACPQQPKIQLPLSRINDGICDCCDGADEATGVCTDDCEIVLAEERRMRKEFESKYQIGSKVRQAKVEEFQRLRIEKLEEASQIQQEIHAMESSLDQLNNSYVLALQEWITKRLKALEERYQSVASSDMRGLVESLSVDELIFWIVHACQISGEMIVDGQIDESKTCIPLRMAGLDSSIWWEPKTYEPVIVSEDDSEKTLQLAKLWDYNLNNPSQLVWHPTNLPAKDDNGRRRLQEEEEDYDYYDEDIHDDYYDRYDDEEMDFDHDPDYDDKYERHKHNYGKASNYDSEEATTNKREEILGIIKNLPIAVVRMTFLEKSEKLLLKIEELMKEDDEDQVPETPEEVEKVDDEDDASSEEREFDPMVFPMVKNQLTLRQKAISRGLDYAVSAYVLVESLQNYQFTSPHDFEVHLKRLAWNILNHGNLSAVHIWQLYVAGVEDLRGDIPTDSEETCVAPWASPCPPSTVTRVSSGEEIALPPLPVFEAGAEYCNALYSRSMEATCASEDVVPTEVPDGYFGYHLVSQRASDDLVAKLYQGLEYLSHESPEKEQVNSLKSQLSELESDLGNQKSKKSAAESSVGGVEDAEMFGPDGELHSLKDECFSFEAAKYTYDLCLFKGAKQKESSHGGVNLGEWKDAAIDSETGNRLWNWTKGTKCWNGPQRSATAVVTCGPETRIISADEPETCRYVFEVESPVGCDIAFADRHNL